MKIYGLADALISLYPSAQWTLRGDEYVGLEWNSTEIDMPTEQELLDEIERLEHEQSLVIYKEHRAAEYPDFRDYLDGIVKGDEAYIDACLAVKAKYPKPE
jgi:tRNA A37 N6-isopentenylltransferase MiaA